MTILPTPDFARGLQALPKRAREEVAALLRDLEAVRNVREIPGVTPASGDVYVISLRRSRVFIAATEADETTGLLLAVKDASDRRGPLPIVVGVTGHRDLRPDDADALENCVRDAFDELLSTYPRTPLLLISPLAAGADQLVARIALTYQIPVVAPLPLEVQEYERDFQGQQTEQFRNLLARAQCKFFVGYAPGNGPVNVRTSEAARSDQYAKVGSYVARNSQILLALWDGRSLGRVGGTSEIVRFKREGRGAGFESGPRPLDLPEYGPVWHIVTPRASDPTDPPAMPFTRTILWPEPSRPTGAEADQQEREPSNAAVTERILHRMDLFNRDALRIGADDRTIATERIRATAEKLASRYQRFTMRALTWLYLAAFGAAAFFIFYAHVPPHLTWLLAFDVAFTLVALIAFLFAQRRELQNLHQDYRAIAEGLRIQEHWHQANLRETVADHYLRQYRGELDWIRNAIRVCRLLDETAAVDEDASLEQRRADVKAVYDTWITGADGQIDYFGKRARVDERKERRYTMLSWSAATVSILATITLAVWYWLLAHPRELENPPREDPWWVAGIVTIAVTAVLSGLLASYAEKRAYGVHVKRYRRMRSVFVQAAARLDAVVHKEQFTKSDYEQAQSVIRELGEEALLENAGWVILHRERPLEFVQGG